MDKLVIDSTVFVSALGKPDDFSVGSKQFLTKLLKHASLQLIVPTIVAAETINILQKQGKSVKNLFSYFCGFTLFSLDADFLNQFARNLKASSLKTSDAIIAVSAKLNHALLISWDRQLLSSKNTLCQTLSPKEYLAQQKN